MGQIIKEANKVVYGQANLIDTGVNYFGGRGLKIHVSSQRILLNTKYCNVQFSSWIRRLIKYKSKGKSQEQKRPMTHTSKTFGIISSLQSFTNCSLSNVGSILMISVKTCDISVLENTPPEKRKYCEWQKKIGQTSLNLCKQCSLPILQFYRSQTSLNCGISSLPGCAPVPSNCVHLSATDVMSESNPSGTTCFASSGQHSKLRTISIVITMKTFSIALFLFKR